MGGAGPLKVCTVMHGLTRAPVLWPDKVNGAHMDEKKRGGDGLKPFH